MTGPFAAWRSWQERRLILRDVRRHAADAREVNQFKIKDQLTFADTALDNSDERQATDIWTKLVADYPAESLQSALALRVLMRLRRFDEAATMMHSGRKRHPADPIFLQGLAQIAQAKGDHDEAILRYAELRKRFPGTMEGYTSAVHSLIVKNRVNEAEKLAEKAMKLFRSKVNPFMEYANIAVLREDWEEALQRWRPVCEQFDHVIGTAGSARALSRLGRYPEAEELLQKARYRFGADPLPLSEYARVAEVKGDAAEVVQRWKDVLYRFPLDMYVYLSAADAFEKFGEPAEAEATLRAAIDRFPSQFRPMLDLAKLLLNKRQDFVGAVEAWAAIRRDFPDNEAAYAGGAEALRRTGRPADAEALLLEYRLRSKVS